MTGNIGTIDRVLRALIGIALLALALGGFVPALAVGAPKWIAVAVGVVMLATAGLRFCPLYRIFGIRTCQR
jgi:VIT1/CCC1 family predicted Fe2+/Mn2+ transporter